MKEAFEKIKERLEEESQYSCSHCMERAISIVSEVEAEYGNGWIPCSERMPEIDGNTSDTVLVCTIDGFQHMAFWCDDEKWRYCESGMIQNPMDWTEIIAWMPLPSPYKPTTD